MNSRLAATAAERWGVPAALVAAVILLGAAGCGASSADARETTVKNGIGGSSTSTVEEDDPVDPRDPFNIKGVVDGKPVSVMDTILGAAGFAAEQVAERRGELERAAQTLEITSIMSGATPLACINGKIVRVEAIVESGGEAFRVVKIEKDAAVLAAEDQDFGLTVSDNTAVMVTLRRGAPPEIAPAAESD